MARETVVSRFNLRGREILSSYAAYTIEGVMSAKVKKGRDSWPMIFYTISRGQITCIVHGTYLESYFS